MGIFSSRYTLGGDGRALDSPLSRATATRKYLARRRSACYNLSSRGGMSRRASRAAQAAEGSGRMPRKSAGLTDNGDTAERDIVRGFIIRAQRNGGKDDLAIRATLPSAMKAAMTLHATGEYSAVAVFQARSSVVAWDSSEDTE